MKSLLNITNSNFMYSDKEANLVNECVKHFDFEVKTLSDKESFPIDANDVLLIDQLAYECTGLEKAIEYSKINKDCLVILSYTRVLNKEEQLEARMNNVLLLRKPILPQNLIRKLKGIL